MGEKKNSVELKGFVKGVFVLCCVCSLPNHLRAFPNVLDGACPWPCCASTFRRIILAALASSNAQSWRMAAMLSCSMARWRSGRSTGINSMARLMWSWNFGPPLARSSSLSMSFHELPASSLASVCGDGTRRPADSPLLPPAACADASPSAAVGLGCIRILPSPSVFCLDAAAADCDCGRRCFFFFFCWWAWPSSECDISLLGMLAAVLLMVPPPPSTNIDSEDASFDFCVLRGLDSEALGWGFDFDLDLDLDLLRPPPPAIAAAIVSADVRTDGRRGETMPPPPPFWPFRPADAGPLAGTPEAFPGGLSPALTKVP